MGYISLSRFGLGAINPATNRAATASSPRSSSQSLFAARLENRIDNLHKGRQTYDDRQVDYEVGQRDNAVYTALSSTNPKALKSYSAIQSGLNYESSARLASSVSNIVQSLASIPTKEEAQAQTDKIIAAYKKNPAADSSSEYKEGSSDATPEPVPLTSPLFSPASLTKILAAYVVSVRKLGVAAVTQAEDET